MCRCAVIATHTQKSFASILSKEPAGAYVSLQTNFILTSPVAYMTSKSTVFVADIDTVYSHIASQNCFILTYFVTKKSWWLEVAAERPV